MINRNFVQKVEEPINRKIIVEKPKEIFHKNLWSEDEKIVEVCGKIDEQRHCIRRAMESLNEIFILFFTKNQAGRRIDEQSLLIKNLHKLLVMEKKKTVEYVTGMISAEIFIRIGIESLNDLFILFLREVEGSQIIDKQKLRSRS